MNVFACQNYQQPCRNRNNLKLCLNTSKIKSHNRRWDWALVFWLERAEEIAGWGSWEETQGHGSQVRFFHPTKSETDWTCKRGLKDPEGAKRRMESKAAAAAAVEGKSEGNMKWQVRWGGAPELEIYLQTHLTSPSILALLSPSLSPHLIYIVYTLDCISA